MILLFSLLFSLLGGLTLLFTWLHFRYHHPREKHLQADRNRLLQLLNRPEYRLPNGAPPTPEFLPNQVEIRLHRRSWNDLEAGVVAGADGQPLAAWATLYFKSGAPGALLLLRIRGEARPYTLRLREENGLLFQGERHIALLETDGVWREPLRQQRIGRLAITEQGQLTWTSAAGRVGVLHGKSESSRPLWQWLDTPSEAEQSWGLLVGLIRILPLNRRLSLIPVLSLQAAPKG